MSQTRVLVWGNNNQNLLSTAPNQCLTKPQQITFQFHILKITATQKHISFITKNGDAYSYGSNTDGRLGIGAKDNFSCHYKNPVKVNLPGKTKEIKSGFSHTLVQLENGEIFAWGLGEYGSLGVGQFRSKYVPTRVLVPSNIRSISCGAMHTSFIDFDGNMFICGSNEYGELGVKSPDKIGTPILIPFTSRVKQIACGVFYTIVLTQNGDVYGMGNNKYAQLGLGHKINEPKPTLIHELTNIVKIQAGYHSGALNAMCELFLWGSGSFGQLLRPKKISLNCPLSNLQIRGFFGIAQSESQNRVFIWGNNTHGQLGNGGYISYKTPTEMKDLSQKRIEKICCGVNFALAIIEDDNYRRQIYQQPQRIDQIQRVQASRRMGEGKRTASYYQQQVSTGRKRYDYKQQPMPDEFSRTQQNPFSQRATPQYKYDRSHSPIHQVSSRKRFEQQLESPQRSVGIREQSSGRRRQQRSANRSVHFSNNNQVQERQPRDTVRSYSSHNRNYEELFMNLSKDYETLAKRYKQLESQIEEREVRRSRDVNATEAQLYNQSQALKEAHLINEALKQQLWMLEKEVITCKQQLAISLQKITQQEDKLEYFSRKELDFMKQNEAQREKIDYLSRKQLELIKQNQAQRDKIEYLSIKQLEALKQLQSQKSKSRTPSSPTRSPIKMIDNKRNDEFLMNEIEEKEDRIRKLEEEKRLLSEKLQEQKIYSTQIETKYKLLSLKQFQLNKNNSQPTKSKPVQPTCPIYEVDLKVIEELKKKLFEKEQTIHHFQKENNLLQDKLEEQKIYSSQIQNKYRKIIDGIEETKIENLNLRETLLKSEDRISVFEGDMRKMIPQKQFETAQQQIVQLKSRTKQLDEKLTKSEFTLKGQIQTVTTLQQQRLKLYNMIESMKNLQKQNKMIADKRVEQEKDKTIKGEQKIKQLQTQVKYQKDYSKKLQQKSLQMDRLRDQAVKEVQRVSEILEKQKKRKKQLERQVQSFKTTEHELKITREQLQKERSLNEDYKDKVLKEYKKKDNLIKEIQKDLEEKEAEMLDVIERKETDIARLKEELKKSADRVDAQRQQVKKLNRQINQKTEVIENLSEEIQKLQRKLKHTKEQMDKETVEREALAQEFGGLKRQHTKLVLEKQEVQKRVLELEKDITQSQNTVRRERNKTAEVQNDLADLQQQLEAQKQQNNYMRGQLDQANAAVQEANKISQQLSDANKQFAQIEQSLNKKIEQLEARVYELQDQNRSYTPRYDALIERNRELDQRNHQLSDMVNKAIEIQAQSYKEHILKQVEVSTNQIINDVQDERIYKQRFNRKAPVNEEENYDDHNEDNSFNNQQPQVVSRVKQQPYTKYMNEKIESHRRRVSESAQKLAGILDLDSGIGSAYSKRNGSVSRRLNNNDENYERINSHMESLKTQKEAFMSKINSFAEKMKLL